MPNLSNDCSIIVAENRLGDSARVKELELGPINGWLDNAFLRRERPPSAGPTAEMSFRNAVAVPESHRINEF